MSLMAHIAPRRRQHLRFRPDPPQEAPHARDEGSRPSGTHQICIVRQRLVPDPFPRASYYSSLTDS
jgi:hypothetical protein